MNTKIPYPEDMAASLSAAAQVLEEHFTELNKLDGLSFSENKVADHLRQAAFSARHAAIGIGNIIEREALEPPTTEDRS